MKQSKFLLPISDSRLISNNNKILIVSIFGQSDYSAKNQKTKFLNINFGKHNSENAFVEGVYDEKEQIVYLHLTSSYDSKQFLENFSQTWKNKSQNSKESENEDEVKDFNFIISESINAYARALLFLFHVSHILIINQPGYNFDLNYIQMFKTLENCRQKSSSQVTKLLSYILKEDDHNDWLFHRRLCSPRLLFYFENCPRQLRDPSLLPSLKKLEHSIEDKIYNILRKSKIIGMSSDSSLFTIPMNQEFVYVNSSIDPTSNRLSYSVHSLLKACQPTAYANVNFLYNDNSPLEVFKYSSNRKDTDPRTFEKFVHEHINHALTKEFDEGAERVKPVFIKPNLSIWCEVANSLYNYFLLKVETNSKTGTAEDENKVYDEDESIDEDILSKEFNTLNVNTRFSEQRCRKVLPLAFARYQDSLPSHYTTTYHENRLNIAMTVFTNHARGPMFDKYSKQLCDECKSYFENGHQLCEFPSLTGNPCSVPKHGVDKEHSSGVRYIAACDCGGIQRPREDPYTIKEANCTFYEHLRGECSCGHLERVEFPVFEPSTHEYKAADLLNETTEPIKTPVGFLTPSGVSNKGRSMETMMDRLSINTPCSDASIDTSKSIVQQNNQTTDNGTNANLEDYNIRGNEIENEKIESNLEECVEDKSDLKSLSRQPSTTEYLPGMLTLNSPIGLLAQFQSWSLVCLGPSSLYSHNIGLTESQHPGFLSGSNYLLPWDETIIANSKQILDYRKYTGSTSRSGRGDRNKKTPPNSNELTVKIFIGVEYECPRGHRFMMSSPDKILRAQSGIVKDPGVKVTKSDMPLYFNCPCRINKPPLVARLMRLHVVTPKTLVNVMIHPRIQPAENSPIFIPTFDLPIKLSQSTYWVLRLPYIYATDGDPYLAPLTVIPSNQPTAKLLLGTWKVVNNFQ